MQETTYRGSDVGTLNRYLIWLRSQAGFEVANITLTSNGWVIRVLLASPKKLPPEA